MSHSTDFSELGPGLPPAPEDAITAGDEVLARLLDRVSRQPDFPSLGQALSGVRRVARSEKARLQNLTDALMQDIGLSSRVLRMANSAHYGSAGAGEIDTLERAVAVMGFVEVGRLALTARLVDSLRSTGQIQPLREPFLRALLAGAVAHELAHSQAEDGTLIAVLRNLGRLVAALHLPDEALTIQQARPLDTSPWDEALTTRRLLGTDFHRLGQAVAERWGWPPTLRRAIAHGEEPPRHYPHSRTEQLRCMGWLANELADLLLDQPAAGHDEALAALTVRFGAATAHDAASMSAALQRVRPAIDPLCEQLGLPRTPLPRPRVHSAVPVLPVPGTTVVTRSAPAEAPAADALPRRVLLGLLRLLGAQRAVLCWRRGRAGELVGEMGLADGVDPGHVHFLVPPDDDLDLFSLLCRRGADTCIDDAADPAIARHLPHWWRSRIAARSLVVLPMRHDGQLLGMLYADAPRPASLRPDAATLARLRAWRDELLQGRLGA